MPYDHRPWLELPGLAGEIAPAAGDGKLPEPAEHAASFAAGDVVRLRSGGPPVTAALLAARPRAGNVHDTKAHDSGTTW
jgi:hypothetical protein